MECCDDTVRERMDEASVDPPAAVVCAKVLVLASLDMTNRHFHDFGSLGPHAPRASSVPSPGLRQPHVTRSAPSDHWANKY